jgi:hypothetical protein
MLREQIKSSKDSFDAMKRGSDAVTATAKQAAAAAQSEAAVAQKQLETFTSNQAAMSSMMEAMAQMLKLAGQEAAAAKMAALQTAASGSSSGSAGTSKPPSMSTVFQAMTDGAKSVKDSQERDRHQLAATTLQNQGLERALDRVAPASRAQRHASALTAKTTLAKESLLWADKKRTLCESSTSDAAAGGKPSSATLIATNSITGVQIHTGWLSTTGAPVGVSSGVISGASRRGWMPVVMKLFPSAAVGDSLSKKLTQEIHLLGHMGDCSRIVSMFGQCSGLVCETVRCQAVVMEAGGAVMVMPHWSLEHSVAVSGGTAVVSSILSEALSVDASTGLSQAVSELGKPDDCGDLKLISQPGTTVLDVLKDTAGMNAQLGAALAVCRSMSDLREAVCVAASELLSSAKLVEAVRSYLDDIAILALPEGCEDIDDLGDSDLHTILCWYLLPLRRRLELCREMAWGVAEVHLGRSLPAGVHDWGVAEARACWESQTSGAGIAAAAAAAAGAAAASSAMPAAASVPSGSGAAATSVGFVHRDIKPDNLFVFPGFKVKVGDLGEAKREAEMTMATAASKGRPVPRGTVEYISPEMWEVREPDANKSPVDVYSLGASMVPLLSMGESSPWSRRLHKAGVPSLKTEETVKLWVTSAERPSWEDDLTSWERGEGVQCLDGKGDVVREWWSLIEACWAHDAASRPSALEVGCRLTEMLEKALRGCA